MPTGKEKGRELTMKQKRTALQLSERFESNLGFKGWVTGPNPEYFEKNDDSVSLPHLVVAPWGFLISEMGEKIGNIKDGLPSYFYELYLEEKGFI